MFRSVSKVLPVFARQTSTVNVVRQTSLQFVRTFSAEAKEEAKEPVFKGLQINSHTGRIAGQIFQTAEEHFLEHDPVLESLSVINEAISEDPLLKMYLEDSSNTTADKSETLHELYIQLETNDAECFIDELAEDTIDLLIENKELTLLPEVVADYGRMVLDFNDEIEAVVTTAQPMTEEQEQRVYDRLSELAGEDKTVLMDTDTNPDLLGGMTIHFGDQFQDLSVRSALTAAESALRAQ